MRGSPLYPQVPEVHTGQLHLKAEDNPDSEECRIRATIFTVLWSLLQSKGSLSLATGSRREARLRQQTQGTAMKTDISVKTFHPQAPACPALDIEAVMHKTNTAQNREVLKT